MKSELYRTLCTIREMLNDRGIEGVDTSLQHVGVEELAALMQARQTFNIDIPDKVRIIYDTGAKIKFPDIKKLAEEEEFPLCIIVSREKVGANEQKKLHELKCEYQLFEMRELQFNISKHMLVPKHEHITDEAEIESIVKRHTLKSRLQLPIILKTDPQAKYLNAKPGTIVRITRHCPTAGEHVVYRCCM